MRLHRLLRLAEHTLQRAADSRAHRTSRIWIRVYREQAALIDGFHRPVHIKERDLFERLSQTGPGDTLPRGDQTRTPEHADDISHNDRIHPNTSGHMVGAVLRLWI
jgi:hypothetical protein